MNTLLDYRVSHPYNPDIANSFFRAGKIEAWDRRIGRIFHACREDEAPAPELGYEANGSCLEFPFAKDYLDILAGNQTAAPEGAKTSAKTSVKASVKTADALLELLGRNPQMTSAEAARPPGGYPGSARTMSCNHRRAK